MSLPGQVFGRELITGPIPDKLGSHLKGRDLPELKGEFEPRAHDLARIAISLAEEFEAGHPGANFRPESFLMPSDAVHAEAIEIIAEQRAAKDAVKNYSGTIAVDSV